MSKHDIYVLMDFEQVDSYFKLKPYYLINKNGDIFSTYSNKFLCPQEDKDGYKIIYLTLESGKKNNFRLHRLIKQTFDPIDSPENNVVDHLDGNKGNNHLENLDWCDNVTNSKRAAENGLYTTGERNKASLYSDGFIACLCSILEKETHFKTIRNSLCRNGFESEIISNISLTRLINRLRKSDKRKRTREKYNFKEVKRRSYTDRDTAIRICELIEEGFTRKQISLKIFGNSDQSNRNLVGNIKTKKAFKHINDKYNF